MIPTFLIPSIVNFIIVLLKLRRSRQMYRGWRPSVALIESTRASFLKLFRQMYIRHRGNFRVYASRQFVPYVFHKIKTMHHLTEQQVQDFPMHMHGEILFINVTAEGCFVSLGYGTPPVQIFHNSLPFLYRGDNFSFPPINSNIESYLVEAARQLTFYGEGCTFLPHLVTTNIAEHRALLHYVQANAEQIHDMRTPDIGEISDSDGEDAQTAPDQLPEANGPSVQVPVIENDRQREEEPPQEQAGLGSQPEPQTSTQTATPRNQDQECSILFENIEIQAIPCGSRAAGSGGMCRPPTPHVSKTPDLDSPEIFFSDSGDE